MKPVVPRTPDELYTALGEAVVNATRQHGCDPTLVGVYILAAANQPRALNQLCGKLWCALYVKQLRALALVAERALAEDWPHVSLMSDMGNDLHGFWSFLRTCKPQYMFDIFEAGMSNEDNQQVAALLRLLVQIAQDITAAIDAAKEQG